MLSAWPKAEDEESIYDRASALQEPPVSERLLAMRPKVTSAYSAYEDAAGQCWALAPMGLDTAADSQYLQDNYERLSRVALKHVRARVLARSRRCMRCGHAAACELDHHLPRSVFPEYSALTLNLVPSCHACNHRKGTKRLSSSGEPLFPHPYFDQLPETEIYLAVGVAPTPPLAITFTVVRPPSMDPSIHRRLVNQFVELRLADMFEDVATEELLEQKDYLYSIHADLGAAAVSEHLRKMATSSLSPLYVNHWKVRLYQTLADDVAFCAGGFAILGPPGPVA